MVLGILSPKSEPRTAFAFHADESQLQPSRVETFCTSKKISALASHPIRSTPSKIGNSTLLDHGFNSPSSSTSDLFSYLDRSSLLSSPFTELSPPSDNLSPFLRFCSISFMSIILSFNPLMSALISAVNLPCSLVNFSNVTVLCSILTSFTSDFLLDPASRTKLLRTQNKQPKIRQEHIEILNNLCLFLQTVQLELSQRKQLFLSHWTSPVNKTIIKKSSHFPKPVGLYLKTNLNQLTNHSLNLYFLHFSYNTPSMSFPYFLS